MAELIEQKIGNMPTFFAAHIPQYWVFIKRTGTERLALTEYAGCNPEGKTSDATGATMPDVLHSLHGTCTIKTTSLLAGIIIALKRLFKHESIGSTG